MRIIKVPYIDTSALPKLCRNKNCTKDPLYGSLWCKDHQPLKWPIKWPEKKRGYVYFIEGNNKIRIGFTKSRFNQRFGALKSSSPVELTVLCVIETDIAEYVEKQLHESFKHYRLHGEWFEKNPRLHQLIEIVQAGDSAKITEFIEKL